MLYRLTVEQGERKHVSGSLEF